MPLFIIRLIARLPLPILHGLGRVLGLFIYALPGRYRSRLRANAAQAGYPQAAFARRAAAETGAMIVETPKVWLFPEYCVDRTFSNDDHVITDALAENRGILFLTPHLGCYEITARHISGLVPLTVMFRPPRQRFLVPIMKHIRDTPRVTAVPATTQGVRAFVRALKRGESVGMLPDQVPSSGTGVWATFFDKPAYTVTLPGKLAIQTGVAVIIAVGERLPRGKGWRIHFTRVPDPIPTDARQQAQLFNSQMETLIRRIPEQYLWSYNRYKAPGGSPQPSDVMSADAS